MLSFDVVDGRWDHPADVSGNICRREVRGLTTIQGDKLKASQLRSQRK